MEGRTSFVNPREVETAGVKVKVDAPIANVFSLAFSTAVPDGLEFPKALNMIAPSAKSDCWLPPLFELKFSGFPCAGSAAFAVSPGFAGFPRFGGFGFAGLGSAGSSFAGSGFTG